MLDACDFFWDFVATLLLMWCFYLHKREEKKKRNNNYSKGKEVTRRSVKNKDLGEVERLWMFLESKGD